MVRSVHPRSRGKYALNMELATSLIGSSPLAREIPEKGGRRATDNRFIPARAGNTLQTVVCVDVETVHPRSRGKYSST